MTDVRSPRVDPGHLLSPKEWARVRADAERLGALHDVHPKAAYGLSRSSFPSVSGFLQCKYDGGAQPAGGPKFGVLHDAETPLQAGYAGSIASYFTRNTNSTSAHFMVDPVATVQMLDTGRIAWHCGNGNTRSIGVEQAGYAAFTAAQWTTADGLQQMARVASLMRDIHAAIGIGLYWMSDQQLRDAYAGRIVGGWATHAQCSRVLGGSTHTDPTPNYPFDQLMATANNTPGGFLMALSDQEQLDLHNWTQQLYNAMFAGGPSMPGGLPLPQSTAYAVWQTTVTRADAAGKIQQIPAIQELADAKSQAIAANAALTSVVQELASAKGVDPAAIGQAVQDAVTAALAASTVKVDVNVAGAQSAAS